MAEILPLVQVLRAVLKEDRNFLSRREDLLVAMEKRVTSDLIRDYRSFQKAIQGSMVGEMFLAADNGSFEEQEQVRTQALAELMSLGMQERAAKRVIETIAQSLEWLEIDDEVDTEIIDDVKPEPMAEHSEDNVVTETDAVVYLPSDEETENNVLTNVQVPATVPEKQVERRLSWACSCGRMDNHGNFCVNCGISRDKGEVDPAIFWNCICGQHNNKGKFCVHCGRSRQEGKQLPGTLPHVWACQCGHRGNTGDFCTNCGTTRTKGEVEMWSCACGFQENTGNFCTNCGRPRYS